MKTKSIISAFLFLLLSFTCFSFAIAQITDTTINNVIHLIGGGAQAVAPQYSGLILLLSSIATGVTTLIFSIIHRKHTINKWTKKGKINRDL